MSIYSESQSFTIEKNALQLLLRMSIRIITWLRSALLLATLRFAAFSFIFFSTQLSCSSKTTQKTEPDLAKQTKPNAQLETQRANERQNVNLKPLPQTSKSKKQEPPYHTKTNPTENVVQRARLKVKPQNNGKAMPAKALLVPPPPPDTPVLPVGGDVTHSQMPLYFLTLDDLRQHKKELQSQTKALKTEIQEKEQQATDKGTRAKNFAGLYEEGVVSRRELEEAKSDKQEADKQLESAKSKLLELEDLAKRVDQKIAKYYKVSTSAKKKNEKTGKRARSENNNEGSCRSLSHKTEDRAAVMATDKPEKNSKQQEAKTSQNTKAEKTTGMKN